MFLYKEAIWFSTEPFPPHPVITHVLLTGGPLSSGSGKQMDLCHFDDRSTDLESLNSATSFSCRWDLRKDNCMSKSKYSLFIVEPMADDPDRIIYSNQYLKYSQQQSQSFWVGHKINNYIKCRGKRVWWLTRDQNFFSRRGGCSESLFAASRTARGGHGVIWLSRRLLVIHTCKSIPTVIVISCL